MITTALALMLAAGQANPLPPGNALPPPGTEEAAVLAPVNALFAALAARDGRAIAGSIRPEGSVTVATEKDDGTRSIRHLTLAEFAAGLKPGAERFEERLIGPAIEIDGDIAMVWGRYDFLIDGKVHHCGVDHFGLVREEGAWKVASLAWSSRTRGCEG